MAKTKSNELKFSIQNLIDTTTTTCDKDEQKSSINIQSRQASLPLKRFAVEPQRPLARRPVIPALNQKIPHPYWTFLSQTSNKYSTGSIPLNSPMLLLNKINQVWEQIHRNQISSLSTATTAAAPTAVTIENDQTSDDDIDMEASSVQHEIEIEDDDDNEDDDDEAEEGECSSSGGLCKKLKLLPNSDENDKLKTYPCTQCGKVYNFTF